MQDEIQLFASYLVHPDTNRSAFEALLNEAMADCEYAATLTVVSVIMNEVQS